VDRSLGEPIPISLQDGLLFSYGEALTTRDQRCDIDPGDSLGTPPGSRRMLIDVGTPITVVSDVAGGAAQPFRHGQVQIDATLPDGGEGAARFLLCDVPLIRGDQPQSEFRLERQEPGGALATTGPLAAVLGADLFTRFGLTLQWRGGASPKEPYLSIHKSDVAPSCMVDGAVLPFTPVGGDLLVQVGDAVVTYLPNRVTVPACIEPIADPLAFRPTGASVQACIDESKLNEAQCQSATTEDAVALGSAVDEQHLRRPAYDASGVNMRFLLSTAVPDLLLSETACRRLAGGDKRCQCDDSQKVSIRLPGLNGPQSGGAPAVEKGCKLRLGGGGRSALALVARGLHLSPCAELARSRRQRYALPALTPPTGVTLAPSCLREACLQNLAREGNLTIERCAYTGMQVEQACDDHQAPVAAYVELGGPPDDPLLPDDTIEALVVPDTAGLLQSVNADLRNMTSQVDGVIGVSLLQRLHTVVDYPQNRLVLRCRCGGGPGQACRTYRGITYYDADHCSPDPSLIIPGDFGRIGCR
jgi:hypothetical protein